MRFVDQNKITSFIPPDWISRAQKLREALIQTDKDGRSVLINENSALWKELKLILSSATHKKCWYCESLETRSDCDVDHYRPKNKVFECTEHTGYWWLAFDWCNYRFSCIYCNRRRADVLREITGGKGAHFPLFEEQRRAFTPDDDLDSEQPLLLDPIRASDPAALWFDEDGQPRLNPGVTSSQDSYISQQVEKSISFYHLDHTDLVERRRILCNEIRELVNDADKFFAKYDSGDTSAHSAFANAVKRLQRLTEKDQEYSATARCMLKGLRATSNAARAALDA